MKTFFKIFNIFIAVILIFAAIGVALLAFPIFGNKALIVRSGSMTPTIGVGAIVVVRDTKANYKTGDIISFRSEKNSSTIITHRVKSVLKNGETTSYKTKGDANQEEDGWTVAQKNVLGKQFLTIPSAGKVLVFARSKYGFPLLIIFPAVVVILMEAFNIIKEIRKHAKKNSQTNPSAYFRPSFGFKKYQQKNHNWSRGALMLAPLLIFGFFIQSTLAFFADTESSPGNFFQAAAVFPTPVGGTPTPTPDPNSTPTPTPSVSLTPTPSVSLTPTPTPSGSGSCGGLNIEILGNGAGSQNNVIALCNNLNNVTQTNNTTTNTTVVTNSNTGNNSQTNNTGSTNTVVTGGSSNTTTVTTTSSSNTTTSH